MLRTLKRKVYYVIQIVFRIVEYSALSEEVVGAWGLAFRLVNCSNLLLREIAIYRSKNREEHDKALSRHLDGIL